MVLMLLSIAGRRGGDQKTTMGVQFRFLFAHSWARVGVNLSERGAPAPVFPSLRHIHRSYSYTGRHGGVDDDEGAPFRGILFEVISGSATRALYGITRVSRPRRIVTVTMLIGGRTATSVFHHRKGEPLHYRTRKKRIHRIGDVTDARPVQFLLTIFNVDHAA